MPASVSEGVEGCLAEHPGSKITMNVAFRCFFFVLLKLEHTSSRNSSEQKQKIHKTKHETPEWRSCLKSCLLTTPQSSMTWNTRKRNHPCFLSGNDGLTSYPHRIPLTSVTFGRTNTSYKQNLFRECSLNHCKKAIVQRHVA